MNHIATIGVFDASITYTDRPTVKVIIIDGDKILLLNDGLLPGGGIDADESDQDAVSRELQEELGAIVTNLQEIGEIVQYRHFLEKRYIIHGYAAKLKSIGGPTSPQDVGEAQFIPRWFTRDDALRFVAASIEAAESKPMSDDTHQGKLYNLQSTYELLKTFNL